MPFSTSFTPRGSVKRTKTFFRSRRAVRIAWSGLAVLGALTSACSAGGTRSLSAPERTAIADSLETLVRSAYDLTKGGDVVERFMSLYPPSGSVVSATAGRVSTSRDSLQAGIRSFWTVAGRFMVEPKWTWGRMHVEVITPDAAVMTTNYIVPHRTPRGEPHVIGGAWTMLWERRDGRWMIVQEHLSDIPRAVAEQVEASLAADSAKADAH